MQVLGCICGKKYKFLDDHLKIMPSCPSCGRKLFPEEARPDGLSELPEEVLKKKVQPSWFKTEVKPGAAVESARNKELEAARQRIDKLEKEIEKKTKLFDREHMENRLKVIDLEKELKAVRAKLRGVEAERRKTGETSVKRNAEIRRLKAELEETRAKGKAEIRQLKEDLEEVRAKGEAEIEHLKEELEEARSERSEAAPAAPPPMEEPSPHPEADEPPPVDRRRKRPPARRMSPIASFFARGRRRDR